METRERVVLLDDQGFEAGSRLKSEIHGASTPLHLGFSCYVVDTSGQILVTRRALSKLTWPGVWTNSYCGHPLPDEQLQDAVTRRAQQELGTSVANAQCVLPNFRYRAVDAGGIEENELCPVFVAELDGPLEPNPSEVADWAWIDVSGLAEAVERAPFAFSPWMVSQIPKLLEARAFEASS